MRTFEQELAMVASNARKVKINSRAVEKSALALSEMAARMGVEAKATKSVVEMLFDAEDAQQWDGQGLPPVGCVCEIPMQSVGWVEVLCVGFDKHDDAPVFLVNGDWVKYKSSKEFRPLRTDRERSIYEAASALAAGGVDDGVARKLAESLNNYGFTVSPLPTP